MRDACAADDPWHGYRQKFRVFFREASTPTAFLTIDGLLCLHEKAAPLWLVYRS